MAEQQRPMWLLLLVVSGLVIVLGGWGSYKALYSGDPGVPNAGLLARRALDAMADAPSYNMAFVIESEPGLPIWEFDFVAPDSYRIWQAGVDGSSSQSCRSAPDGETVCETIEEEEGERFTYEVVIVSDESFARKCDVNRENCDAWEEGERPPLALAGPSPTFAPGWPLVAIELAEWDAAGEETVDGGRAYTIRGTVNHMRAIFENERRILTAAGITSFGTECSSGPNETPVSIGENLAGDEPEGLEECHELTYEESLEQQEPDLSFFDASPAMIEVAISGDSSYVRRVEISAGAPPDHEPDAAVRLVIEYSRFGEVTVEAPR